MRGDLLPGNLLVYGDQRVQLHADEIGHRGAEGPDGHEGLHSRPDHPGDGQHLQPVWQVHRSHGSQPGAGERALIHKSFFWLPDSAI